MAPMLLVAIANISGGSSGEEIDPFRPARASREQLAFHYTG